MTGWLSYGKARAFASSVRHFKRLRLPNGVTVGRHTYGHDRYTFPMFTDRGSITVGAFCSFSPEVRVLGGGEHVTTRASTFPLATRFAKPGGSSSLDSVDKGPTTIGNDVWIGLGAILLSGVTIGDGAVIGAGAVVRASVPPYAIVAGNPAELVRYRFDADVRQRLLALQWWNWDDREIFAALPWFMRGVDAFLEEMERTHRSASPS